MQIMVPDRTVGLIIGRGGETIRDLQERSGCHVNIVGEQKSVNGLRPVNLIGSREAAARAKDLIMEIVESDSKSGAATKDRVPAPRDGGRDAGYGAVYGGAVADKTNDSIFVPSEAVGMIIGKGGETIKEMQATTGCKINVSPSSGPGEVEREIGLVGSRDAIAAAKRAIEDKVEAVVSRLYRLLYLALMRDRHKRPLEAEVAELALPRIRTIMEIERTLNHRTLSHKDSSRLKRQPKRLLLLGPKTLMQLVSQQLALILPFR
jgi:rRNA processing protein Krr1/Pno1